MTSGRVWPNGAFGLTTLERTFQMDAFQPAKELTTEQVFIIKSIHEYGVEATLEAVMKCRAEFNPESIPVEGSEAAPIDSTSVANSHSDRRGQRGMSTYGRLLVSNAAWLIEKSSPLGTVTFLTLTLPPMELTANRTVVEKWAEVVRVLQQRLKRGLVAAGLRGEMVGCTEIQEKRLDKAHTGLGLHLHIVFQGRKSDGPWALHPNEIREAWESAILSVVSGQEGKLNMMASVDTKCVMKSVAGYIGKYLSKGVKSVDRVKALFPGLRLPACWYLCSIVLRERVKKLTLGGSRAAKQIVEWIEQGRDDMFQSLRFVTYRTAEGAEFLCGYAGRLSDRGRSLLGLAYTAKGMERTKAVML